MNTTTEIVESIDARLELIQREIEALGAARAALNGDSPGAQALEAAGGTDPAPKPARASRRRRRKRKPATEVVPAGKLELLLAGTDGLTTTVLAERANGARDQVLTLLRELEAAGRVRRTGVRRSTRWHVITDDDRIAERAAQLAAQSRAAAENQS
jgi:hypothetical protein